MILKSLYMFHLESQMVSDAYSGEKFGSGVYYRLVYGKGREEEKQRLLPRDSLILRQGMPDQPPGAHAQKVLHSVRGVARPLQLLLQGREGVLPEAPYRT